MRGFVMAALMAVVCASAWAASPAKEPLPQASAPKQSASANNRGTEQSPLFVNIQAVPPPTQEERDEKAAERHEKAEADAWLIRLTAVLAVATVALVGATGFLWWSTRRLVKGAEDTAKRQLRAYVALEHIEMLHGTLPIRVQNYGSTPAHRMTIWVKSAQPKDGMDIDYSPHPSATVGDQMLHPTQGYSFRWDIPDYSDQDRLFVFGRIAYQDIYERWWMTRFCYRYDTGQQVFMPYGQHNREDGPYDSMKAALEAPGAV